SVAPESVGTSNFQADEAVKIGSIGDLEWTVARFHHLHLGQHILWVLAVVGGASLQGSNTRVAGRNPLAFGRQGAIRRTGANDDPIAVGTIFGWQREVAGEGRTCLKLDGVSADGAVQGRLQIAAGVNADDGSGRWRLRHGAGYRRHRQLRRTVIAIAGQDGEAECTGCRLAL